MRDDRAARDRETQPTQVAHLLRARAEQQASRSERHRSTLQQLELDNLRLLSAEAELHQRIGELERELEVHRQALEEARASSQSMEALADAMQRSMSWRLTTPLRRIAASGRKLRSQLFARG